MEVAANIQSGNTEGYKKEATQDDDYAKLNVVKVDGAYYNQNERVRILMDGEADRSLSDLLYDRQVTTALRLIRSYNGEIEKIEYLILTQVKEIFRELDITH